MLELFQDAELTAVETGRLAALEQTIERGLQTFVDVGTALLEIRDSRLYRQTFGTFEDYCRDRWGMSRSYAHRTIEAAQVASNLLPIGNIPATESQARPLTGLSAELQREAWQRAVDTAPNGKITAAHVASVVDELTVEDDEPEEWNDDPPYAATKPHVAHNSGNNEWYTPAEYIQAARRVMGYIDLDPASSEAANEVVGATAYYTAEDDGLSLPWVGKVWMNPPYAKALVEQFADKMAYHVGNGDVTEAIVLVNNATETAWFRKLIGVAAAVAFPASRVKFWQPNSEPGAPLQGQACIYIGHAPDLFLSEFTALGWGATL